MADGGEVVDADDRDVVRDTQAGSALTGTTVVITFGPVDGLLTALEQHLH